MNLKKITVALGLILPIMVVQAAEPAAKVVLVTGVAMVGARTLSAGDSVSAGDTVVTGANSYANLRFADGGRVLLRPNTEFTIEEFRYEPGAPPAPAPAPAPEAAAPATTTAAGAPERPAAPASAVPPAVAPATSPSEIPDSAPAPVVGQSAFFRLARGGFRAISGLIGHSDRAGYRVSTPSATIGIRGTDYEAQLCAGDCPSTTEQASSSGIEVAANDLTGLQLAQAGSSAESGLVVATNEGSIVLQTPRGEFTVDAGQVALAMANGQVFQLPAVPDLMLINPTPKPDTCQ